MGNYFRITEYKTKWLVSWPENTHFGSPESYHKALQLIFTTLKVRVAQLLVSKDRYKFVSYEIDERLYFQVADELVSTLQKYFCSGLIFDDHETALAAQLELDRIRMWNLLKG
jgi:hypothetical protein